MRYLLSILLFYCLNSSAQNQITGYVIDHHATPLPYTTVALLHPEDSTMSYFGITANDGSWVIKNIKDGNYLLQVSFLGYKTWYQFLNIPLAEDKPLSILLHQLEQQVKEVNITGERIPVRIKQDTVEYDAGAFKTKPDAVAEDLLKKLPGVEVDRSGNVKAQGENITNVLVDGKEFFSNDPKVATKNLPANAIDKVQVYDKKSEQSELTGVDDGEREKTINLVLKDDHKSAVFGDVAAGAGTDEHYKISSKIYRFTAKQQLAFLGMLNNINETGFSFRDYMDFNGGMRNMSDGSGMEFTFNSNSSPVNFGETQYGKITSGATGINYTYEAIKNNRINISYMASGANKKINSNIYTQNFAQNNEFYTDENDSENNENRNQNLSVNFRNRPDSTQNISINTSLSYTNQNSKTNDYTLTYRNSYSENELTDNGTEKENGLSGRVKASYLKRFKSKWSVLKVNADAVYNSTETNTDWSNIGRFFLTGIYTSQSNFRDNINEKQSYTGSLSITRKTGDYYQIEPGTEAGMVLQSANRTEGIINEETPIIDYLFSTQYNFIRPSLTFKFNKKKKHLSLSFKTEFMEINNQLGDQNIYTKNYIYLTPRFNYENEYKSGRRYSVNYNARINQPSVNSLLPVTNNRNPLLISFGNPSLKPEYQHQIRANWSIFDQFSFTSFFSGFSFTYVKDKVTWQTTINDDLSRIQTPVNTDNYYTSSINADVSTPIRPLKININLELGESYNKGINIINGNENTTESFTHEARLSLENRKKDKVQISVGSAASLTNNLYSADDNTAGYLTLTYFADLNIQPNDKWSLVASAEINSYYSESFRNQNLVPLIQAELTRYFLTSKRFSLSIQAYDILNQNTGIERVSELNYIKETTSDVIGRYILLAVKFRLNKADNKSGGIQLDIRK